MEKYRFDLHEIESKFSIKFKSPDAKEVDYTRRYRRLNAIRSFYIKHRNVLSRIWKENESERIIMEDHHFSHHIHNCAAEKQFNKETGEYEKPYYHYEWICLIDVVPKEHLPNFINALDKFKSNCSKGGIEFVHYKESKIDMYKQVFDSSFFANLAAFGFEQGSVFSEFTDSVAVELQSLSSTFCLVSFNFRLNEKWKNKISDWVVNNCSEYTYAHIPEETKIKDIRKTGMGNYSNGLYKKTVFQLVLNEISYELMEGLNRYFKLLVYNQMHSPMAFHIIRTNIDENSSESFWSSLDICNFMCDKVVNESGCILWGKSPSVIEYIYRNAETDKYDGEMFAYELKRSMSSYLAAQGMTLSIRSMLEQWYENISKTTKQSFSHWAGFKANLNENSMYGTRFLKEYKGEKIGIEGEFWNVRGKPVVDGISSLIDEEIRECENLLKCVLDIIDAKVEAKNFQETYNLQVRTMIINLASAVLALVAILISVWGKIPLQTIVVFWGKYKIIIVILVIVAVVLITIRRWMNKRKENIFSFRK